MNWRKAADSHSAGPLSNVQDKETFKCHSQKFMSSKLDMNSVHDTVTRHQEPL